MDEDARRAIRESRPGYAADSIRSILRMAADRDAAKVDQIQSIYLSRRVNPLELDEVLGNVKQLVDALGRDDDERKTLAVAFQKVGVDVDGDGDEAWLRLADDWLRHIGVEV